MEVEDIRRLYSMFVSAKLAFSTAGYAGFKACGEDALATSVKQEQAKSREVCSPYLTCRNLLRLRRGGCQNVLAE